MSLKFIRVTEWMVCQWVRAYTVGLPAEVKTSRRDEIASDIWEQKHEALLSGHKQRSVAWYILARSLSGLADDLSWRIENSKLAKWSNYMNLARFLIRPSTYFNLVSLLIGMLILFPIGVGAFVLAVVAAVVPPVLLASVFIYKITDIQIGTVLIDTFPEAIAVSLVGLVLVLAELFIANAIVTALRRFVSLRVGNLRFGQIA